MDTLTGNSAKGNVYSGGTEHVWKNVLLGAKLLEYCIPDNEGNVQGAHCVGVRPSFSNCTRMFGETIAM